MYYKKRMKTYSRLRKTKKLGKRKLKYRNTKMRRKNSRKNSRKNKYKGGAPKMYFHQPPSQRSQQQPQQQSQQQSQQHPQQPQQQPPLPTTELLPPLPTTELLPPHAYAGHTQEVLIINGVSYQGADIFILTKRADEICIILFNPIHEGKSTNIVNMPGGRRERLHASLEAVASQELFEESACTIRISEQEFTKTLHYDLAGSVGGEFGKRRTYLVYIPDTADIETNYIKNLKNIKKNRRSELDKYRETNWIVFIPLQTIINLLPDRKQYPKEQYPEECNDIKDIPRKVNWRIFKIVEKLKSKLKLKSK